MPKINVYLPDDLAAAVREAGLSVSPICQRALGEAVRTVTLAREAVVVLRDEEAGAERVRPVIARVVPRMTPRLEHVLHDATELAGEPGRVTEADLLVGLIDQPDNLGIQVLTSLHVDVSALRAATVRKRRRGRVAAAEIPPADDPSVLISELSSAARSVLAGAIQATLDQGSDYLGCSHLLLGLTDAEDGADGGPLHGAGVTHEKVGEAMPIVASAAALGRRDAGSVFEPLGIERFGAIDRRLEALERRLSEAGL